MLMVAGEGDVQAALMPVAEELGLHLHVDTIEGGLHQHRFPNYQVRVHGADRAGIVAQVTGALAAAGFNILELESDVAGTASKPVYIMNIQGYAEDTLESLQGAMAGLAAQGVEVSISPVDMLYG